MLVVGGKEVETGTVSYRDRIDGDLGALPLDEVVRLRLKAEVDARTIRQVVGGSHRAPEEERPRSTPIDRPGAIGKTVPS